MSYVNKSLQKKDAMALVTGKPVYTDDLAPKDCLIIKILRSPYANAWVEEIKTDTAMKVEGMALILTWKDVPKRRFASAGQTYPEFSPYDRMILEDGIPRAFPRIRRRWNGTCVEETTFSLPK